MEYHLVRISSAHLQLNQRHRYSRQTIDKKGKNTNISVRGRHDPCVGIRAVPIGEAMLACVLLDHYLMNKAQCGS